MKKNFLKIFIFIMIIFLTPKVFAQEFNMNSYTSATKDGTTNRYRATEIYNTGFSNTYTFGTQYSGRISDIETYFDYPFVSNTTYTLTYNMNTEDFRNNFGSSYWWDCSQEMTNLNATVVSPSYISMKKVKFTFRTSADTTCIRVWLRSTNLSSTAITGVSNWRLNNITIYDPDFQDGSSGGQGTSPAPTSSPNSNQDIINNQNTNTQEIINNNNDNTNSIIENNNSNTQEIIDNQNKNTDSINQQLGSCFTNIFDKDSYIPFIQGFKLSGLTPGKQYKFYSSSDFSWFKISTSVQGLGYYEYYGNNIKILTFTAPENVNDYWLFLGDSTNWVNNSSWFYNNADLMLFASPFPSNDIDFIGYNEKICSSKIDDTNSAINEVNNSINNPNIDSGIGSDFFNDFQDNTHGLTGIITAPLTAIQSITSSACQPLTIPIPFTNGSVSLPCMTAIYEQNIPTIYNIWKIVSFGIIAYFICIDIFHIVKGFKDPESDKVEVLDL